MEAFDRETENGCYYVLSAIMVLMILSVSIVRILSLDVFHLFPDCMFWSLTGYYCPGCGGTRAVRALLQLDFLKSFLYHPLVLYSAIVIGGFWMTKTVELLSKGRYKNVRLRPLYFYIAIAIVLVQWLAKNMIIYFCGIRVLG